MFSSDRVKIAPALKVLDHYESQTDEQAIAEDEADFADRPETVISIPVDLVPAVRELLGKQQENLNS